MAVVGNGRLVNLVGESTRGIDRYAALVMVLQQTRDCGRRSWIGRKQSRRRSWWCFVRGIFLLWDPAKERTIIEIGRLQRPQTQYFIEWRSSGRNKKEKEARQED